jgi:hypothetical protein
MRMTLSTKEFDTGEREFFAWGDTRPVDFFVANLGDLRKENCCLLAGGGPCVGESLHKDQP